MFLSTVGDIAVARRAKQPEGLISVLLDKKRDFGDRHDAALDLARYDGYKVESALLSVVQDFDEDEDLVEEIAESLYELWRETSKPSMSLIETMHPVARRRFEPET